MVQPDPEIWVSVPQIQLNNTMVFLIIWTKLFQSETFLDVGAGTPNLSTGVKQNF